MRAVLLQTVDSKIKLEKQVFVFGTDRDKFFGEGKVDVSGTRWLTPLWLPSGKSINILLRRAPFSNSSTFCVNRTQMFLGKN